MTRKKRTTNTQETKDPASMAPGAAAAYWDARLRSPDCSDEERAAFRAWRDGEPENESAFEAMQTLLGALRGQGEAPEMRAMRDDALSFAHKKTGRELPPGAPVSRPR